MAITADLEQVKDRFGLENVSNDLEGLRKFYRTWSLKLNFDNLTKTESLFRQPESKPPFIDATRFFDNWLNYGISGTCWPHANALYTLAKEYGFDAYRATASMFDIGPANHGTTLVKLPDGTTWLLDDAFLNMEPLRIDPEQPSFIDSPVQYAEVEIDGDDVFIHSSIPPFPHIFFRLLERDVPASTYEQQWDELCLMGPFNSGAHVLRNYGNRLVLLRGAALFVKDENGMERRELSGADLKRELVETMGVSPDFVEQWAASGALEASLQPPGPMPDLPKRMPPSKRA